MLERFIQKNKLSPKEQENLENLEFSNQIGSDNDREARNRLFRGEMSMHQNGGIDTEKLHQPKSPKLSDKDIMALQALGEKSYEIKKRIDALNVKIQKLEQVSEEGIPVNSYADYTFLTQRKAKLERELNKIDDYFARLKESGKNSIRKN